jgi:hypothetical protein
MSDDLPGIPAAEDRALILHPAAQREKETLMGEITEFEHEYDQLRGRYSTFLELLTRIDQDFSDQIGRVRANEIQSLRGASVEREAAFWDWFNGPETGDPSRDVQALDDEVPDVLDSGTSLSEKDQALGKALWHDISKITHPDRTDDDVLCELYKRASTAYKEGDLFTLRLIWRELSGERGAFSQHMGQTNEGLMSQRDELMIVIEELRDHLNGMNFGGIRFMDFMDGNGDLDVTRIMEEIRSILSFMLKSLPKPQDTEEALSEGGSDETSLVVSGSLSSALRVVSPEEKEQMLQGRLARLIPRLDAISPYYAVPGVNERTVTFRLLSDESRIAESVMVLSPPTSDLLREREGLPVDDSSIVDIILAGQVFRFLRYPDGRLVIPSSTVDDFSNSLEVLERLERFFLQNDVMVLNVGDNRGDMVSILGHYDELMSDRIKTEYRLNQLSEVMVTRLIRALLFLKIPRHRMWEPVSTLCVYSEEEGMSFDYDGSLGDVSVDDVITMMVQDTDGRGRPEGEPRPFEGKVFEFNDEVIGRDQFSELLGWQSAQFSGHLSALDRSDIPVSITLQTGGSLRQVAISLRRSGYFAAQIKIGEQRVVIRYDQRSPDSEPVLSVSSIDESLLPELLRQLVLGLRVESVEGQNWRGEGDVYM